MERLGTVKNGVVVLEGDTTLIEGKSVRVIVQEAEDKKIPTPYEVFKDLIGVIDGPPDLSENHDHYAHGAPKRSQP